ncbi:hypothetical protein JCM11251_000394 [Rhodosporidiobolus azoricus]
MRSFALATTALTLASTAHAFTYSIGVGKNETTGQPGIGFDPSYTVIVPHSDGNELAWEFLAGTHRVVETSGVDNPCNLMDGGYDSGVVRVPAGTLQGNGPSQSLQLQNDSAVRYFADVGEDFSACYLGAVFCINTNEADPTSACYAARAAALALGQQYGVTATPSNTVSGSASSTPASSSSSAAASSTTTSAPSSSQTNSGSAGRTASANNAAASGNSGSGGGNSAGAVKASGAVGALVALAGVAMLA